MARALWREGLPSRAWGHSPAGGPGRPGELSAHPVYTAMSRWGRRTSSSTSPKEKFADQQRECRMDIHGLEGGAQLVSPSPPGPSVPDSLCPLSLHPPRWMLCMPLGQSLHSAVALPAGPWPRTLLTRRALSSHRMWCQGEALLPRPAERASQRK